MTTWLQPLVEHQILHIPQKPAKFLLGRNLSQLRMKILNNLVEMWSGRSWEATNLKYFMKVMEANTASNWFLLSMVLFLSLQLTQCSVTYDRKALIINGRRRILFPGSIHYPRSTPQVVYKFSLLSQFHSLIQCS